MIPAVIDFPANAKSLLEQRGRGEEKINRRLAALIMDLRRGVEGSREGMGQEKP